MVDRFAGLLLGTAVGDALGLPAEGLSPTRIQKRWKGAWRMRWVFGRGMVSDDTEHTFLVAQSLLASPADAAGFRRSLAACLRWWFLALPAGVGWATARACLKLWLGIPPERSGVWSAGNGPAMRSAVLGAFFAAEEERRREFVTACTRLTHTDPRAEIAALAVAEAAAWIVNEGDSSNGFVDQLRRCGEAEEWQAMCRKLDQAIGAGASVSDFIRLLGLERGVTGYAFHTAPVAIYAWWRHRNDFRAALTGALAGGGDTDSVGAMTGALAGCAVGQSGIPTEWLGRLWEWPRTPEKMQVAALRLVQAREQSIPQPAVRYFRLGVLPRNLFFLLVVFVHGLRRLLPPY